jgi:hypothetical protein
MTLFGRSSCGGFGAALIALETSAALCTQYLSKRRAIPKSQDKSIRRLSLCKSKKSLADQGFLLHAAASAIVPAIHVADLPPAFAPPR